MAYVFSEKDTKCQKANLWNLFNNEKHYDVTFSVGVGDGTERFTAHRLFLSSISPVFEAMLFGHLQKDQPDAEISIQDIDADAFHEVLKYAYCNEPHITAQNVLLIEQICDKYQITGLSEICQQYLEKIISANNICSLLQQTVQLKSQSAMQIIDKSLKKTLIDGAIVTNSTDFLRMNVEAMTVLLKSDKLSIDEMKLWDAILRWAEYHAVHSQNSKQNHEQPKKKQKHNTNNTRIQMLQSIAPFIRFGCMDPTYFVKHVKPLNCLNYKEMTQILSYLQCPDESCGAFSVERRIQIHDLSK